MSIILGNKTITDIYLGDKSIVNGWVGDKLVFGKTEGVWWERHKWLRLDGYCGIDTGVTPQYGDCLSSVIRLNTEEYRSNGQKAWNQVTVDYRGPYNNIYALQVSGNYYMHAYPRINIGTATRTNDNADSYFSNMSLTFYNGIEVISASVIVSETAQEQAKSATCTWLHNGEEIPLTFNSTDFTKEDFNGHYFIGNRYNYYNYCCCWHKDIKISAHTYTPCQLLRTLPASKAWDGKTHSAGECGMWDSVSDKFYGNASSSGSFTVSDED